MIKRIIVALLLVFATVGLTGCGAGTVAKCLVLDNTNRPCN